MLAVDSKVTKLIALTASDRMEEARTAAYLACKVIREKGLYVVTELPSEVPQTCAPRRGAHPEPPPWRPAHYRADTTDAPKPRTIVTKFDCTCLDCGSQIYVGDRCVWLKGKGCWHPECAP